MSILTLFQRGRRAASAPTVDVVGGLTRRGLALAAGGAVLGRLPAAAAAATRGPEGFAALDAATLETLVRGLADLDTVGDAGLSAQTAAMLDDIAAALPGAQAMYRLHALFRARSDHWADGVHRPSPTVDAALIETACRTSTPLAIGYTDLKGQTSSRVIWPLMTVYPDHGVLVLAQCQLRGAFRQFFLHAMTEAQPMPGDFAASRAGLLDQMADLLEDRHGHWRHGQG